MSDDLAAIIQEIRDRVRAQYPNGATAAGVALPDLTPVLHARDAAEAKVAAIGTVNPRSPGLLNSVVQSAKRLVARALDWHVRDQIEFNRAMVRALNAALETLNENNRVLQALAKRVEDVAVRSESRTDALSAHVEQRVGEMLGELQEFRDIRTHWSQWRVEWEHKLSETEKHFFRTVADLHGAFQHRATLMESTLRETVKLQHSDFNTALGRSILDTQKALAADFERVRADFERMIRAELRLIRQRSMIAPQPAARAEAAGEIPAAPLVLDWLHFANRFRGAEDTVREKQRFYIPHFAGCQNTLDLGCGRGEFLELMKEAGVPARGVDLSAESVAICRSKGLDADAADLFEYLRALPDASLDGVFCAQVIEHLPPARLPEMLHLVCGKLDRGGVLAIETPNPECLAILATHFYLDPTHIHPVPPRLLAFYLEELGMDRIEVHRLFPAVETMPELNSLPADFRDAFFGALDYAVVARKV